MKTHTCCLMRWTTAAVLLVNTQFIVGAATHYVWQGSLNPTPPYSSWATAAHVIQDAVDAAVAGDEIVVTNGVYSTGRRAMRGAMANRVAVDKPLTLRSVNGPEVTIIQGAKASGGGNGDGAVRCVYLVNDAVLSGFTLTNGATRTEGNSRQHRSGGGVCCESATAIVTNCVLRGNSAASEGGGVYEGTLYNCTLVDNSATSGGGAASSTMNNCTLTGNSATFGGGGAYYGTLNNCTLTGNVGAEAGGAFASRLNNCIVYYNSASIGANYRYGTQNYCCITPRPDKGVGNITLEPRLAGVSHLSADSPCRGAGDVAYAVGVDVDGEPWGSPPSIGCDEYQPGALTGPLTVTIEAPETILAARYELELTAWIDGRVSASVWNFGDGTVLSNRPYARHAWAEAGDYRVELRAYNEDHPEGISAWVTLQVSRQPVHHVSAGSTNPVPPYTSWATAARTIQEAVNTTTMLGALVLVTNGVYATGGRAVDGTATSRVAVDRPVVVQSVNGAEVTVIEGHQGLGPSNRNGAVRGVYLANGAVLSGFTVTHGHAGSGGGVHCESVSAVVSNCTLLANSASVHGGGAFSGTLNNCILTGNSAGQGGGAYYCALSNCTITGNSAAWGGGTRACTLNNCTIAGNTADSGGGAYTGTLNNCIVFYNTAAINPNYTSYCLLRHSSTTPMPAKGVGNITNAPLFVNTNNWANLRLQPNSPCIDAGNNDFATSLTDLDDNPRILNGIVDMGAYELVPLPPPNTPPVADASATQRRWISPNGVGAMGIVDGSRSSDPNGDSLAYEWFSGPISIARGVIATVPLPVGTNAIILVVDDGLATDTNSVVVTVRTTAQAVSGLKAMVNESDLHQKRPLLASLEAALASIERGNHNSTTGQLGAFRNKVRAQVSRKDASLAMELMEAASEVITVMETECSPIMAAKIHSAEHRAGTTTLLIESPTHHLGDNPGNEGIVFEKSFFVDDVGRLATLEFDIVEPWGPNLESPPEVYMNDLFAGSLGPFFPPLDLTQDEWVTNADGSHDYNKGFHVSLPVTSLLVEGENLFRIQNGRPDDDYYFEGVKLLILPDPDTVPLEAFSSMAPVADESARLAGHIHSINHRNHRVLLEIRGEAGQSYILEGSTNLVDWNPICVVQPDGDGNCGYEDVLTPSQTCRFYRVVPIK